MRYLAIITTLLPAVALAGEPLTPDRAAAIAVAGHPALAAADREVAAAEADRALARSGWLPRIELQEDVARSTNPVFVFAGKLGQERFGMADFAIDALNTPDALTNAATRLVLRQNVWDADRTRLGTRAAGVGIEAATLARSREADAVALAARKAFWDAVLAERMLAAAKAGEDAAAENARLAGARVEEGLAVPSDRLQAEVRLAEVRAQRLRAEGAVAASRAALRFALGTREDATYELRPPEVAPRGVSTSTGEPVRDDLASLDRRLEQARLGETMARRRRLPEIGLGAQYEWNDTTPFGTEGSNWTVGASLRLPIFDGLETRARVARARADRERLEAFRTQAGEGARLERAAARADVSSAGGRLAAARSTLGLAEESLRIVRERYDEGLAVMVELLSAEAALTGARGELASAEHDLAIANATLDFAEGRKLAPATPENE